MLPHDYQPEHYESLLTRKVARYLPSFEKQIEAGKYPVNLDLVSERLMESYLEMKG